MWWADGMLVQGAEDMWREETPAKAFGRAEDGTTLCFERNMSHWGQKVGSLLCAGKISLVKACHGACGSWHSLDTKAGFLLEKFELCNFLHKWI